MTNLPSIRRKVQIEETDFRSPVSESTFQKFGSSVNYILDYFTLIPGLVLPYAGFEVNLDLDAFIPCDGRAVNRTYYANLFAAINTQYGIGDGVLTFNVPDLRGQFVRGVNRTSIGNSNRDEGEASRTPTGTGLFYEPGSIIGPNLGSHNHGIRSNQGIPGGGWARVGDAGGPVTTYSDAAGGFGETFPTNMYMLYVIKT
jgi:hypothetical protein